MKERAARLRSRCLCILLSSAIWLVPVLAQGVILDGNNSVTVKLGDGTDVTMIGVFESKISHEPLSARRDWTAPIGQGRDAAAQRAEELRSRAGAPVPTRIQDLVNNGRVFAGRQDFRQVIDARRHVEHKKRQGIPYYYLPPQNSLHLSMRPDGSAPEFLFVKYTTEETEAAGGIQGGLMHFLMEWGLSTSQEKELADKLYEQYGGKLMGPVPLDEGGEQGSFRIVSGTLSDDGLTRSLVQSGHAPTMPGGRVAVAANLSKHGAQLFMATVEQSESIADLSVELSFSYVVQMPAAKGIVMFHWDRLQERQETVEASSVEVTTSYNVDQDCAQILGANVYCNVQIAPQKTFTQEEVRGLFNTMVEQGVVEMYFEGYQPDSEYTTAVLDAMLQYFQNSLMQPADESLTLPEDENEEVPLPDKDSYIFNYDSLESLHAQKDQTVYLDAGFAVRRPLQVVGNMASWYKANQHNEKCVQTVNLNDPFFEHREIRFIVDLDAKEIFEDMINYVTVNVRKERKGDRTDFERSVTIDQAYLKDHGVAASLTYAREDDKGTESYKYQTQWSLKGGNLFSTAWKKGSWEGVTLAPPVERWYVEVEGDLDEMEASDISRATVELHYPLFKKEEFKVIPLSVRSGEFVVGEHIYVDSGTRGFAYRLILHHKKEGRMVLPWQARVGDRYVYAAIPEDILEVGGVAREHAKDAAKKIGVMGAERVLNQFNELFAGAD